MQVLRVLNHLLFGFVDVSFIRIDLLPPFYTVFSERQKQSETLKILDISEEAAQLYRQTIERQRRRRKKKRKKNNLLWSQERQS